MASNVFNSRNELSTLRRCPSDMHLGFKWLDQSCLPAGPTQKHVQNSCIFFPALILGRVRVTVQLWEARQRDGRCWAPGWPLSCGHCPSSTPWLKQFSSCMNCADHAASSPWKDLKSVERPQVRGRTSSLWKDLKSVERPQVRGRTSSPWKDLKSVERPQVRGRMEWSPVGSQVL